MCLAVPVKVIDIEEDVFAHVEIHGVKLKVSRMLIDELNVGDYVLVHAGFIIEKLSLEDAQDKLELYAEYQEKAGIV